MIQDVLLTYQDVAARWQVNPKTVSRWVLALERRRVIEPLRPTNNTVRLTSAMVALLESRRIRKKKK